MKQVLSFVGAMMVTAFFGGQASAQVPVLTNEDVAHLVAMRVSDQTVIAVIREATATQFDLSPGAVTELASREIPAAVIAAMRQPSTSTPKPTSAIVMPEPASAAGAQTLAGAAAEAAVATHTWPLSANPSSEVPASASIAPAATANDASSTPAMDEAYWRGRVAPLHLTLRDSRAKEGPLLNRINSLTAELSRNAPGNAKRGGVETERQRLTTELAALRESLRADMAAIQALEEEGGRAGVPLGWLR
jgi:hypothetical protein